MNTKHTKIVFLLSIIFLMTMPVVLAESTILSPISDLIGPLIQQVFGSDNIDSVYLKFILFIAVFTIVYAALQKVSFLSKDGSKRSGISITLSIIIGLIGTLLMPEALARAIFLSYAGLFGLILLLAPIVALFAVLQFAAPDNWLTRIGKGVLAILIAWTIYARDSLFGGEGSNALPNWLASDPPADVSFSMAGILDVVALVFLLLGLWHLTVAIFSMFRGGSKESDITSIYEGELQQNNGTRRRGLTERISERSEPFRSWLDGEDPNLKARSQAIVNKLYKNTSDLKGLILGSELNNVLFDFVRSKEFEDDKALLEHTGVVKETIENLLRSIKNVIELGNSHSFAIVEGIATNTESRIPYMYLSREDFVSYVYNLDRQMYLNIGTLSRFNGSLTNMLKSGNINDIVEFFITFRNMACKNNKPSFDKMLSSQVVAAEKFADLSGEVVKIDVAFRELFNTNGILSSPSAVTKKREEIRRLVSQAHQTYIDLVKDVQVGFLSLSFKYSNSAPPSIRPSWSGYAELANKWSQFEQKLSDALSHSINGTSDEFDNSIAEMDALIKGAATKGGFNIFSELNISSFADYFNTAHPNFAKASSSGTSSGSTSSGSTSPSSTSPSSTSPSSTSPSSTSSGSKGSGSTR